MKKAGTFKIKDNWRFIYRDFKGNIIKEFTKTNTVTNIAKGIIRDWLYGDSETAPTSIGIGTGTTSETASDTSLETEYTRASATKSKPSSYVVKYSKTFTFVSGTSEDITESALFNSATSGGGEMYARTTFGAIAITGASSLTIDCELTIA